MNQLEYDFLRKLLKEQNPLGIYVIEARATDESWRRDQALRRGHQHRRGRCALGAWADVLPEAGVDVSRAHRDPAGADAQRWGDCAGEVHRRQALVRCRWGADRSAA